MEFNYIVNPESGKNVSIYGKTGKKVLRNYVKYLQKLGKGKRKKSHRKKKKSKKKKSKKKKSKKRKSKRQSKDNNQTGGNPCRGCKCVPDDTTVDELLADADKVLATPLEFDTAVPATSPSLPVGVAPPASAPSPAPANATATSSAPANASMAPIMRRQSSDDFAAGVMGIHSYPGAADQLERLVTNPRRYFNDQEKRWVTSKK